MYSRVHEGVDPNASLPQGAFGSSQWPVAGPFVCLAAVVRGEDDEEVVHQTQLPQIVGDVAEPLVHRRHHRALRPAPGALRQQCTV